MKITKNNFEYLLTEEEKFRVVELVRHWGLNFHSVIDDLTEDHILNSKHLDKCDACAGPMYDCYVDTHQSYLKSKGLLPYQRWYRFKDEFEEWLDKQPGMVFFEDYEYIFEYKIADLEADGIIDSSELKYIMRCIDRHNWRYQTCQRIHEEDCQYLARRLVGHAKEIYESNDEELPF